MGWKVSIVQKDTDEEIDPVGHDECDTLEEALAFVEGFMSHVDVDLIREIVITKVH